MTKPKLLIVEDDAALAAQYRWAFPDCRVLLAHDRAGAIAMAQREQPAAVLLDLGLPPDAEGVAEGFATLEALQLLTPGLPVIVASGQGERANMLRAVALGAYDFCEKPVDLAVLRTIIDRALRLRRRKPAPARLAPIANPARPVAPPRGARLDSPDQCRCRYSAQHKSRRWQAALPLRGFQQDWYRTWFRTPQKSAHNLRFSPQCHWRGAHANRWQH